MPERPLSGPADYLAAERTFLAWIRSGLALMAFGFVVARFGLFLEALQIGPRNLHVQPFGLSFWFGTTFILLGVIVNGFSVWNHFRLVQYLQRGESGFAKPSWLATTVALILAVLGLAMAIYLFSVREPDGTHQAKEESMNASSANGVVTIPGHQSVDQTVEKLKGILEAKGAKLFTVVDHSGEAEKAGMTMPNTKLFDLRQSESRDPAHACLAQYCDRSPVEDSCMGGHKSRGVGLVQCAGLSSGASQSADGLSAEYSRSGWIGGQS